MKNGGIIRTCKCEHEGQDKLHGKGRRVHTLTKEGTRCTVCLNEITTDMYKEKVIHTPVKERSATS